MAAGYTSSTARGGLFNQVGGPSSLADVNFLRSQSGDFDVAGNITVGGTVDGRDVATDGTKLDGIEALADVTDVTNVTAAGALMDSELTDIASVKALDQGVSTTDSPSFAGLTTTGNVGIGITPESWNSNYTALQFAGNGALIGWGNQQSGATVYLGQNSYVDAGGWKYISTDEASRYEQVNGQHTFYTASSGTADTAIAWTESMRINAAGDVAVTGDVTAVNGTFTSVVTANLATISSTGDLAVADGGTGGSTALAARTNLDVDQAGEALALAIALG